MSAKHFRWVFLLLVLAWWAVLLSSTRGLTIGLSERISDGSYNIAGGSAPWALEFAAVIVAFYLWLLFAPKTRQGPAFFGWWQRFAAFWLDFTLAMAITAPIVGLIPMISEWRRTEIFAWNFARTTSAPGDGLLTLSVFAVAIPILVLYFAWPIMRGRPTPGSCVMGYQIAGNQANDITAIAALKRTLLGVTFLSDRKRGFARIDAWAGTRAVKLE